MPSSPDPILGVELQALGENLNVWGDSKLNDALAQLAQAMKSGVSIAVEAPVTLTSTNYVANQARRAVLVFTGSGGETITLAGRQALYLVFNDCAASVTISDGGDTVSLESGEADIIWSDGTDVRALGFATLNTSLAGYLQKTGGTITGALTVEGALSLESPATLTGLASYGSDLSGTYTDRSLVDKGYVDAVAYGSVTIGVNWPDITNKPTTLSGYGITDAQPLDTDLTNIAALSTTTRGRKELIWVETLMSGNVSPVVPWREYYADSGTAARSMTLAAGNDGDRFRVIDKDGNARVNNITVTPDGSETIMGQSELTINVNFFSGEWRYRAADTNWELVA